MTTYVFRNGRLVEKGSALGPVRLQVVGDIAPYQSMIDGSMIAGRAQHRSHLRDHGCIEIGNEKMESKLPPADPRQRRQMLREQLADMTDRQADRIMSGLREQAGQMASRRR